MDPVTKAFIYFIVPFGLVLLVFMRLDLVMHFLTKDERAETLKKKQADADARDAAEAKAAEATPKSDDAGDTPSAQFSESDSAKSDVKKGSPKRSE